LEDVGLTKIEVFEELHFIKLDLLQEKIVLSHCLVWFREIYI